MTHFFSLPHEILTHIVECYMVYGTMPLVLIRLSKRFTSIIVKPMEDSLKEVWIGMSTNTLQSMATFIQQKMWKLHRNVSLVLNNITDTLFTRDAITLYKSLNSSKPPSL